MVQYIFILGPKDSHLIEIQNELANYNMIIILF